MRARASTSLSTGPCTTLEGSARAALHAPQTRHLRWHPCIEPCGRPPEAQTPAKRAHIDRGGPICLSAVCAITLSTPSPPRSLSERRHCLIHRLEHADRPLLCSRAAGRHVVESRLVLLASHGDARRQCRSTSLCPLLGRRLSTGSHRAMARLRIVHDRWYYPLVRYAVHASLCTALDTPPNPVSLTLVGPERG